jgi:hypothetical protein
MNERSSIFMYLQRAVYGGITALAEYVNGLVRATRKQTNRQVGIAGNRTRYPVGMYQKYMKKWTFVNLSGTAIIN